MELCHHLMSKESSWELNGKLFLGAFLSFSYGKYLTTSQKTNKQKSGKRDCRETDKTIPQAGSCPRLFVGTCWVS